MTGTAEAGAGRTAIVVVALGDMHVSADTDTTLITYALGSCLGVAVHDPVAHVGGLLHTMMPRSAIDPARAEAEPSMFVDTGIPALFRACYALGARKDRLLVRLAGAASIHGAATDQFQIGRRNLQTARQLFLKNNVLIRAQETGGSAWRNMSLNVGSGTVLVRCTGSEIQL